MDELDAQLMSEITAQVNSESTDSAPAAEPAPAQTEAQPETAPAEEVVAPKMYDEKTVKQLRDEAARYRIRAREAEQKLNSQQYTPPAPQEYDQPFSSAPQQVYDPRVDDMILSNKIVEIKNDPYFTEIFKETNDLGETFEERLLEKAYELQWPVAELDALALKMGKDKILSGIKQKGIDEAYKSMSTKAATAPDRGVSSGKGVVEGDVNSFDDAFRRAMHENGVTDLTLLR